LRKLFFKKSFLEVGVFENEYAFIDLILVSVYTGLNDIIIESELAAKYFLTTKFTYGRYIDLCFLDILAHICTKYQPLIGLIHKIISHR
jgi:hypothetical protein